MEVKRLRTLVLEIFKTINNPNHIKNLFTPKTDARIRPNDIFVKSNETTNSDKSLTVLGPKIWNNQLPKILNQKLL